MEDAKLKILFISCWYPNKIRPLNGIFVKRHAAASALNCDVSAIFICGAGSKSIDESVEDGVYTLRGYYKIPSVKIPLITKMVKLVRYMLMWKKVLSFYKNKRGKPDLINSNVVYYPVSIIAPLLKKVWGVPYVITEHWSGYFPEDGRYSGFILTSISRHAVAKAGAVITVSKKLSNTMQALGLKSRYFLIPNVVDTDVFTLKPVRTPDGHFNFIHISSLSGEKNVTGIIRTFKKFHALHPDSRLTLIWDKESKELLDKLNEESFSEADGVFLIGRKVGLELAAVYQQADAFILFSNFENLPVVMLESLCCGVPVIGTRVGDVPEYINENNGLLVDSKNETQLLDAMEKMYSSKGKYNPVEIRREVVDKVNAAAIAKQFLAVYKICLNKN